MTSQNNKDDFKKVSKRTFAPPVAKHHSSLAKGKPEFHSNQDAQCTESPVPPSQAAGDGAVTKLAKAGYPKISTKTQDTKQKGHTSFVKEANCEKEENCLSDVQFEEIVQSVLQKSLQECLGDCRKTSAESTDEQDIGKENQKSPPAVEDATSGKLSRDKDKMMLLEAEQKKHTPKAKEQNKDKSCFVNKNRKEKHEKAEANNGGRKENRKGGPKKKVQGNARIFDQEEMQQQQQQQEEEADRGSGCTWCMAWVQCSYSPCEKWRRLSDDIDPSVLPKDWSCSQNPDLQYNSCSVPEETWSGSENEVVYAVYVPGSIVWAKQYGYPWWPGMVDADPDIGEYFLFSSLSDSLPSKYHVTFFGDSVTRAWILASMLRTFGEPEVEGTGSAKIRNKGDRKNLQTALKMAKEAEQMSIQERIRNFGFCSRFSGKDLAQSCEDYKGISNSACKPRAKRITRPNGGNKSTPISNKSQEGKHFRETLTMELNENLKKKSNMKRTPKSKLAAEGHSPLSKKSRRERLPPKAAAAPEGHGKAKDDQKGFKKSFTMPSHKKTKAELASSCPGSTATNLELSTDSRKEDDLNQAETFHGTDRNEATVNLGESKAFGNDVEETFSSEMTSVLIEEKSYSPENVSLLLLEE